MIDEWFHLFNFNMNTNKPIPPRQGRQGFGAFFGLAGSVIAASLGIGYASYSKNNNTPLFALSVGLGAIGLVTLITSEGLSRPPRHGPHECVKRRRGDEKKKEPILVCLGDSLTHGACSANWVDTLKTEPRAATLEVVNAGQNSICTHTVLQEKVNHVVSCQPDYIFIMIGSNDAMAIYRDDWARQKVSDWNLPERPTEDILIRNLTGILKALLEQTTAVIAISTLPPFGEDIDSSSNKVIQSINSRIKTLEYLFLGEIKNDTRETERVSVIDVNSALWTEINKSRKSTTRVTHSIDVFLPYAMVMGIMHCVLGMSWNTLTRLLTGNVVLSESLHLNEVGGDIVKNEVLTWLIEKMG